MDSTPITIAVLMPHPPVLVPAVGKERLADIQSSLDAVRQVSRAVVETKPDALVVISPHSPRHPLAFGVWTTAELCGDFSPFGAPAARVTLPTDPAFVQALANASPHLGIQLHGIAAGTLDHGAMVPIWFLAEAGWAGPTVVLALNHPGAGGLHEFGRAITEAARATGKKIAIIASGDMSHRLIPGAPAGYEPTAKDFDAEFIRLLREHAYRDIERINPILRARAAEDVIDSCAVAMAATDWNPDGGRVLSYEGPFGVGYGVAILHSRCEDDPSQIRHASALPRIARHAVREALSGRVSVAPEPGTEYLRQRCGVFVTIKTAGGRLRGCVGSLEQPASENIITETIQNAQLAAFRDTRFSPVTTLEMHNLRFEVSILSGFEEISSTEALDPLRYGVIVSTPDGRRATLLPGIPGIESIDQQFHAVCEKGRILPTEPMRIVRYVVEKFKEPGCPD